MLGLCRGSAILAVIVKWVGDGRAYKFCGSVVSNSLQPHGPQHTRVPCHFTISQSLRKLMSTESVMPSNHPILCHPLLLLPSIFPSIRVFSSESALCIKCQSIGASASASVLPMNIQSWFPLGLTDFISLLSKGLSKSSPAPQFKSINSSVLSLLYDPALTSIHDYWKNHSFD